MPKSKSHATQELAAELAANLVENVSELVSPPDVCVQVFELIESGDASAQQIGAVIERDPSLTARLLKLVNSAYYKLSRRIDTVSRAITILGERELYGLVIAVSAVKSFSRLPSDLVNMDSFWRHGMFTGLLARNLAKRLRVLHPERLFVAGLLHDIGSLILYSRLPDVMHDLLAISDGDEALLHQAELAELGFSHADLGGILFERWLLPEALQEVASYHHMPSYAETARIETAIVHLADVLANRSGSGTFCEHAPEKEMQIDDFVWEILALDEHELDLDQLIAEAQAQFTESAGLMLARA